jgi:hypothetical protein
MVKTQIKNEYQESIMDYRNTITRIVQTYDSQSSRLLYRKLAEDILKVAQKTLKHLPIVNYIHLTEALNEITVKNLVDFDEQMLEFTLEKQFELLSVNLTNADKITEPFSISRLNESWLSSLNQRALQARIRNLYNSKYSEKINDPDASREMYRIIETIISVLDDELKVLSIACSYDHMFLLAYADLLSTLCEIISIYVVYEIDDFKTLLRQSFRLFSNLASYLKAKDAYSFHTLFDKAKDIVANSASNSSLFEITFDGLVNLSISAYKNIDTHQYSSRCFDDVIWATTFDGKSSYLDVVVPTLDKYLNSNQLKIYLRDFKRKREHNKMRGAHLHKYESLVVGNKELLDTIEERLNVLITKKIEEETLVVTQDSIGDKKDRIESQPDTIDIDTNATFVSSQTIKPQKKIGHQILNVIKRLF